MPESTIPKVLHQFTSWQFLKFLLIGGLAAAVNFFSRFFFQRFFIYEVSIAWAYTLGTMISFIFNKIFTFKAYNEKMTIQILKFTLQAIVSLVLAIIIVDLVIIAARFLYLPVSRQALETIAHLIAIGLTTIFNFLAMKYFSFRKIGEISLTKEG